MECRFVRKPSVRRGCPGPSILHENAPGHMPGAFHHQKHSRVEGTAQEPNICEATCRTTSVGSPPGDEPPMR